MDVLIASSDAAVETILTTDVGKFDETPEIDFVAKVRQFHLIGSRVEGRFGHGIVKAKERNDIGLVKSRLGEYRVDGVIHEKILPVFLGWYDAWD
jgi:hypothetical protein